MPVQITAERLTSLFRPRSEQAARALLAEAGIPVVPARLAGSVTAAVPDGARIEALDAVVTWKEHSR